MWAAHDRKDANLHQGSALERDNRWAAGARRNLRLNAVERDFLAASAVLAGCSGWRRAYATRGVQGPFTFTPNGGKLVALYRDDVTLVDPATGQVGRSIDTDRLGLGLAGLAPNPRYALLDADALYLVDLTEGRLLESPLAGQYGTEAAAAAGDDRTLATADREHRIRLHDTSTGDIADLAFPGPADPVLAMAFSPGG
jgi:hypothetical protein